MIRRRSVTTLLTVLFLSIAQLDVAAASDAQPAPPETILDAPQKPVVDQDESEKQLLKETSFALADTRHSIRVPNLTVDFREFAANRERLVPLHRQERLRIASVQGGVGLQSETSQSDPKPAVRARRGIMKWILVGTAGGAVAGAFLFLKGYRPTPIVTVGVPTVGVPK